MNTQLVIDESIAEECQERIERILQLQLSSVQTRISSLRVVVSSESSSSSRARFRCELNALLANGQRLQVVMFNAGVHVCVADAAARMVREVRRQRKFSADNRLMETALAAEQVERREARA